VRVNPGAATPAGRAAPSKPELCVAPVAELELELDEEPPGQPARSTATVSAAATVRGREGGAGEVVVGIVVSVREGLRRAASRRYTL
jgi:hypothetical protein